MGDAAHDSVHAKYPGKSYGHTSPFAAKGDLKADYPADSSEKGADDAADDAAAEAAKHDEYDYWVNVCQSVMTPPKVGLRDFDAILSHSPFKVRDGMLLIKISYGGCPTHYSYTVF